MPTKLRGPALDVCPQCGDAKKSYPQHWNRSADCDYPPITSDELHQVVRGIFLSDGSLEGSERAKLRVETTSKELAEWLYDQLGDLAGGLRKHRKELPNSDVYRVSSLAHPDLNQYREWYDGSQKRIPDPDCLDEIGMTVFYALDGSLAWGHEGQRPRITFKAVDGDYREDLGAMLRAYDPKLTVTLASDHVALSAGETDRFLDSLQGSVPGVAHKWATSRIEYDALRQSPADQQEYKTQLCITALETIAEQISGDITPARFDEQVAVVDSATVMDVLGGGSWKSALRVAGVQTPQPPSQTGTPSDRNRGFKRTECREALQAAAAVHGEKLTMAAYSEWADGRDGTPAANTIAWTHYDGWGAACEDAGISSGGHGNYTNQFDPYTVADCVEAIQSAASDQGEPLSQQEYTAWRQADKDAPAVTTISNITGSWTAACDAADVTHGTRGNHAGPS